LKDGEGRGGVIGEVGTVSSLLFLSLALAALNKAALHGAVGSEFGL